MDETGQLEYGQIYVRYTVREDLSGPEFTKDEIQNLNTAPVDDDEADPASNEPETKVLTGESDGENQSKFWENAINQNVPSDAKQVSL